ncbi:MAG: sensor domain-containing diguanylate cyclase [Myxococcales bacterium]|nr:sensor domain-containing diguanylate cyclase [Myxococcales bacterium]
MGSLGPIVRISMGLVLLTGSMLISIDLLGLVPSNDRRHLEARGHLAELTAARAASALQQSDIRGVDAVLLAALESNPDILTAAVRSRDGRLLSQIGEHETSWRPEDPLQSTPTHIRIPVFRSNRHFADVELRFRDEDAISWISTLWHSPLARFVGSVSLIGFFVYGFYLRRTLHHLDPSSVIPTRVQSTLDVMTEGVLIISKEGNIVLANRAFADRLGRSPADLMGRRAAAFDWKDAEGDPVTRNLPWERALAKGESFTGSILTLNHSKKERVILNLNGAPVLNGWGQPTGAIVTFEDVTELEEQRADLERALTELEKSRDEIRFQNEELSILARSDPLTGAANRRSFMEDVEPLLAVARESGKELSCMMVDIDHFKHINDTWGHQAGDEVIRGVADGLRTQLGDTGFVCRYGGEEFCVALPETSCAAARDLAERVRRHFDTPGFAAMPVTASFGISSLTDGATNLSALIDQADRALYFSKEHGRNRVTRFDELSNQS